MKQLTFLSKCKENLEKEEITVKYEKRIREHILIADSAYFST